MRVHAATTAAREPWYEEFGRHIGSLLSTRWTTRRTRVTIADALKRHKKRGPKEGSWFRGTSAAPLPARLLARRKSATYLAPSHAACRTKPFALSITELALRPPGTPLLTTPRGRRSADHHVPRRSIPSLEDAG